MDESVERRIREELQRMSINDLHELGNMAVSLGLILGHGHMKGQYEILSAEGAKMMSPDQARVYLRDLIENKLPGSTGQS